MNMAEGFTKSFKQSQSIAPLMQLECRLCGQSTSKNRNIFGEDGKATKLMHLINLHLPIMVNPNDGFSPWSCNSCSNILLSFHHMVTTCVEVNNRLEAEAQINAFNGKSPISDDLPDIIGFADSIESKGDDLKQMEALSATKKKRRKKIDLAQQSTFQCSICEKTYTRNFNLKRHLQAFHQQLDDAEAISEQKTRRNDIVQRCKNISDSETTFKCDKCEKLFPRAFMLLRHYTRHTDTRNYCCHLCGMSFRVYFTLAQHIKVCHEKVKEFKCEVCEHAFALKSGLHEHMNVHTNNRPFVCDICGKAFRQRSSLYVHTQNLHADDTRYKFTCEFCGKKYCKRSQLKVHERVHTGVKPYKCTACDTEFRYQGGLKRHIRNKGCQPGINK